MADSKQAAAGASSPFIDLIGCWKSRGYGQLLTLSATGYRLYEDTQVSRLLVHSGSLDELAEHYLDLRVSPGGRSFSARRAFGVTRVGFTRLRSLPAGRAESVPGQDPDPCHNFEVLWHTFAEHYALFDLKKIDWAALGRRFRGRVNGETTAAELFAVCEDMLRPLRDGHVQLHAGDDTFSAAAAPRLLRRLAEELQGAEDWRDAQGYAAELRAWLRDIIREDYLLGRTRHAGSRLLEWGALDATTGYLAIRAMAGQCGRPGRPGEDMAVVDAALERVLEDLGDRPAMVLDLRGNGGGYDAVALRLAGYFVGRRRLAFTKAARRGTGFTGRQKVFVEPAGARRYRGRLFVLVSNLTASAAEIFLLALLRRPGVTLVGESSAGILSDTLDRHLPNGWWLTLSNEVYRAASGELYEHRGIPPDVGIPYLDLEGREAGRDPMLDYVLAQGAGSGNAEAAD